MIQGDERGLEGSMKLARRQLQLQALRHTAASPISLLVQTCMARRQLQLQAVRHTQNHPYHCQHRHALLHTIVHLFNAIFAIVYYTCLKKEIVFPLCTSKSKEIVWKNKQRCKINQQFMTVLNMIFKI